MVLLVLLLLLGVEVVVVVVDRVVIISVIRGRELGACMQQVIGIGIVMELSRSS